MREWTSQWTSNKTGQLLVLIKKGKTYPEIAELMGTTRARISSKMERMRRVEEKPKTFNELWFNKAKAMGLTTTGIMI